jgi:hypothetical protein
MKIETYGALVEQMSIDAREFAGRIAPNSELGTAYNEPARYSEVEPGVRELGVPFGVVAVHSVTKYGGTEPLATRCYLLNSHSGSNGIAEGRHLGLGLDVTQSRLAAMRGLELRSVVITRRGGLGLMTEHTHGVPAYRRRVDLSQGVASLFLATGLQTAGTHAIRAAYDEWQHDLSVAAAR